MDRMHTLSQTGPFKIASTLQTLLDQITLNLVYLIIQLPIKTGGSAQIYKRLISLSCRVFLLGKCQLDVGHYGSRSPPRSKFNHTALPGPVVTLISPWLVQEYDLPCFSPGTLLSAPDSDPDVLSARSIHIATNSKLRSSPSAPQIYSIDLHHMWVCCVPRDAMKFAHTIIWCDLLAELSPDASLCHLSACPR